MSKSFLVAFVTASAILFCFPARSTKAELILQFGKEGVVGATDFSVAPGQSQLIDIFLTQTPGDTRLTSPGLGLGAFRLILSSPDITHAPLASFQFGPGFVEGENGLSELNGQTLLIDLKGTPVDPFTVTPVTTTGGSSSIKLGTTVLTAMPGAFGPYGLELRSGRDPVGADPVTPDFILGNSALGAFVAVSPSTATLNVSPVPEPSSFALLIFTATTASIVFRRRRLGNQLA